MIDKQLFTKFTDYPLEVGKIAASFKACGISSLPKFLSLHYMLTGKKNARQEFMVTEITKYADMAMPNTVRMLNEMQLAGYITRRRDGRNVYVSVTQEGLAYHDECMRKLRAYTKALLETLYEEGVTDDEINSYLATATKLRIAYLKNYDKIIRAAGKADV